MTAPAPEGAPSARSPAPEPPVAPPFRGGLDDEDRRRALRRMKAVATGLLVVAGVLYLLARSWERSDDAPVVAGYLRAAAEAGLVGGLADWFAVTALFRRPLGLPIPHTAIIPTRKDEVGRSLGGFVGDNFLSAAVVRRRLASADVARRAGAWLSSPDNARHVGSEAARLARAALAVLRDEDVRPVLDQLIRRGLRGLHVGPPVGALLRGVLDERAHVPLVDALAASLHGWLRANEALVTRVVAEQAPLWSPRLLDIVVSARVHRELVRVSGDVVRDPDHQVRRSIDRYLRRLSEELTDPGSATSVALDGFVTAFVHRADVRAALDGVVAAARRTLLELVDEPDSELRVRLAATIQEWGRRLATDDHLAARVDEYLAGAVVHVTTSYREEITRVITDTVEGWDAEETSRRVENQVGRDLQFIRVNGTLVGALVGIVIHSVAQLLP